MSPGKPSIPAGFAGIVSAAAGAGSAAGQDKQSLASKPKCIDRKREGSQMPRLRIFVASPGDVSQERDIVSVVVQELRRTIGDIRGVELETVRWETHAWPDIGEDAQDVINSQIGEYDVLVGVMWKRFGTPTKRAKSGTGEEFE